MTQNYTVVYSTFSKSDAERYMTANLVEGMDLWQNGSGEWQVRVYK